MKLRGGIATLGAAYALALAGCASRPPQRPAVVELTMPPRSRGELLVDRALDVLSADWRPKHAADLWAWYDSIKIDPGARFDAQLRLLQVAEADKVFAQMEKIRGAEIIDFCLDYAATGEPVALRKRAIEVVTRIGGLDPALEDERITLVRRIADEERGADPSSRAIIEARLRNLNHFCVGCVVQERRAPAPPRPPPPSVIFGRLLGRCVDELISRLPQGTMLRGEVWIDLSLQGAATRVKVMKASPSFDRCVKTTSFSGVVDPTHAGETLVIYVSPDLLRAR